MPVYTNLKNAMSLSYEKPGISDHESLDDLQKSAAARIKRANLDLHPDSLKVQKKIEDESKRIEKQYSAASVYKAVNKAGPDKFTHKAYALLRGAKAGTENGLRKMGMTSLSRYPGCALLGAGSLAAVLGGLLYQHEKNN